jgi:hypothetical protein
VKILRRLEEANIPESFSNNIYLRAHALQAARRKRQLKRHEERSRRKTKEKERKGKPFLLFTRRN